MKTWKTSRQAFHPPTGSTTWSTGSSALTFRQVSHASCVSHWPLSPFAARNPRPCGQALSVNLITPNIQKPMRKITSDIVGAFLERRTRSSGNTHTDGQTLWLHGNRIAWHTPEGIMITLCGWPSVTTRERLNAIPGVCINQRDHKQYLNGREWDGQPELIKTGDQIPWNNFSA